MRKGQEAIYKEGGDKFHDNPPVNKIDRESIKPKKNLLLKIFFAVQKHFLKIAFIAALIWGFGGQLLLEAQLRLATFMGNRAGDFVNAEIKTSLPQEAHKAAIIASEQAQVEVEKGCVSGRNQNAHRAYYDCLATGGTEYLCNFRYQEILKQFCQPLEAKQLEQPSQNPQP